MIFFNEHYFLQVWIHCFLINTCVNCYLLLKGTWNVYDETTLTWTFNCCKLKRKSFSEHRRSNVFLRLRLAGIYEEKIVDLVIIPRARVKYEMEDSQRGS